MILGDVGLTVRALVAWHRRDGRYVPGPGGGVRGYVVTPEAEEEPQRRQQERHSIDLASLWD